METGLIWVLYQLSERFKLGNGIWRIGKGDGEGGENGVCYVAIEVQLDHINIMNCDS